MRSHEIVAASEWVLLSLPSLLVAVMVAVLTPLALAAAHVPCAMRSAAWIAGGIAAIGLLALEPGAIAIVTVVPYAVVAGWAGAIGVARLLARHGPASRIALAAGLVMLPAAATWLLAARAGYALLGYPPFWVILTAAHFHVAGVYLMTIAGRVTHDRGRVAGALALGVVVCVPLTAAGIYGPLWLETLGVLGMAASGLGIAVLLVTTGGLLRAAGVVLLLTMPLAALFGIREPVTVFGLDPLASMMITHGAPNTLVFALLALLALRRAPCAPELYDAPPMSRIAARGRVGADFLVRRGLERDLSSPAGLVDDLAELVEPGLVAPAIRAFYEQTGRHEMIVRPSWRIGFRTGGRVWAAIARRIGQLQLPLALQSDATQQITSRIVAVDAAADGRSAPRSWIRTFADGRALYVAIYSTHTRGGQAHMNIGFPLPGGNLTSILRLVPLAGTNGGVRVTTRLGGDTGVWWVLFGRIPLRSPMSEAIDVWTSDDPAAPADLRTWGTGYTTLARHTLWLFGVRYLTLDYAIRPRVT